MLEHDDNPAVRSEAIDALVPANQQLQRLKLEPIKKEPLKPEPPKTETPKQPLG